MKKIKFKTYVIVSWIFALLGFILRIKADVASIMYAWQPWNNYYGRFYSVLSRIFYIIAGLLLLYLVGLLVYKRYNKKNRN